MNEPLIDRAGRTYEQLVALGKRILPKLHPRTGFFMPRGGRKRGIKNKPKMNTATTSTPPASLTTEGSSAIPAPPEQSAPPPAAEPAPKFDDVSAALRTAPKSDSAEDRAAALADEIETITEATTADTIIGIIQTGLILIGEEEGILSDSEKTLLKGPLERVLKKYGVGNDALPPEVDLALAVLGLLVTRLKKPKTASAFVRFKAWAVRQWTGFQGSKLAAAVEKNA